MTLKTSGPTKAPTLTLHRTTTPLTGEMSPPGACEAAAASASRTVQAWVALQLKDWSAAVARLLPMVTAAFAGGAAAISAVAVAADSATLRQTRFDPPTASLSNCLPVECGTDSLARSQLLLSLLHDLPA